MASLNGFGPGWLDCYTIGLLSSKGWLNWYGGCHTTLAYTVIVKRHLLKGDLVMATLHLSLPDNVGE